MSLARPQTLKSPDTNLWSSNDEPFRVGGHGPVPRGVLQAVGCRLGPNLWPSMTKLLG